jgi:hypothetical protein
MINALLNLVIQAVLLLLGIWLAQALLGLKWRLFRAVRQGYSNLLKTVVVAAATWLWSPEIKREGGGQVAQASSEFNEKEGDEWEELEPEGWP